MFSALLLCLSLALSLGGQSVASQEVGTEDGPKGGIELANGHWVLPGLGSSRGEGDRLCSRQREALLETLHYTALQQQQQQQQEQEQGRAGEKWQGHASPLEVVELVESVLAQVSCSSSSEQQQQQQQQQQYRRQASDWDQNQDARLAILSEAGMEEELSPDERLINVVCVVVCVICAALAAGLTMGLVSIEPLEMAIKMRSGTDEEKARAGKILPLITRHHLLLVTLLLFNSLANEALPIFLDNLLPAYLAVAASVTLVLFFGEILPSAVFTGKYGLQVSAAFAPMVMGLMVVLSPISWPIAWVLDKILGVEGLKTYKRHELAALMEVQHELQQELHEEMLEDTLLKREATNQRLGLPPGTAHGTEERGGGGAGRGGGEGGGGGASGTVNPFTGALVVGGGGGGGEEDIVEMPLHRDEVSIVQGVLNTSERSVADAMVGMDKVYCLHIDAVLDTDTMADMMAAGFSRVLVYAGDDSKNIRGYLQVKKLITLNPEEPRSISSLALRTPEVVSPRKSLLELLNIFQKGRSHLAIISNSPTLTTSFLRENRPLEGAALPLGIITLEDIIEEILQEEIMDESDRLSAYIENRAKGILLKYTQRRRMRKQFGRLAALGAAPPGQGLGDKESPVKRELVRQLSLGGSRSGRRDSLTSPRRSPARRSSRSPTPAAGGGEGRGGGFNTSLSPDGKSYGAVERSDGSGSPLQAYDEEKAGSEPLLRPLLSSSPAGAPGNGSRK